MKKLYCALSFLCLFVGIKVYGQDTTHYLKPQQLKINLDYLGASFSYEQLIDNNSNTLYFDAGIVYGFTYQATFYDDRGRNYYSAQLVPAITAEFRHYYHFKARKENGKNLINNSSNFFALNATYIFAPLHLQNAENNSDVITIMPAWGIQRALGRHFSLELELGLQASYEREFSPFSPATKRWSVGPGMVFRIGYVAK
ncbi:MAG: hypothetical protein ACXVIY_11820 [Mucilaginibacter sp.]